MSLWNFLFDSDLRQRADIDALEQGAVAGATSAAATERRLGHTNERIDQLELMLEGIYRVLEQRGHVTAQEFRDLLVQVDLEDGREDGRVGPDRAAKSPKCTACGRPVNPRRDACVFCNTALSPSAKKPRGPYRR
jgi:hypothetical protein